MRRFAPRLLAALLAFSLGVLVAAVRNDLRFRESSWSFCQRSVSTSPKKCSEKWQDASANKPLGWDLTYLSTMEKLNAGPALLDEWAKPAPPIHQHVSEWQGDPIVSSFEFEISDGHASMVAYWFIRTRNHAYHWTFYPLDTDYSGGKHLIPTEEYDRAFETIACWVAVEPPKQRVGSEGYLGFLSMYEEGRSRQMLLTYADFIESGKFTDEAHTRPGPFARVLEPLRASLKHRTQE